MMGKGFLRRLFGREQKPPANPASGAASGKPDPDDAAGMAFHMNDDASDLDMAGLGAVLGAVGAFDDDDDDDFDDDDDLDDDNDLDDDGFNDDD